MSRRYPHAPVQNSIPDSMSIHNSTYSGQGTQPLSVQISGYTMTSARAVYLSYRQKFIAPNVQLAAESTISPPSTSAGISSAPARMLSFSASKIICLWCFSIYAFMDCICGAGTVFVFAPTAVQMSPASWGSSCSGVYGPGTLPCAGLGEKPNRRVTSFMVFVLL